MQSLNTLILQGKVLYLGISDAPAWLVVKANAYARQHGLRPFSIYQGRYSAQARDLEREIIPMCRDEGMAVHAWGVLGAGYFKPADAAEDQGSRKMPPNMLLGREQQVSKVLGNVARRHGVPIASVAIAYVLAKVCPSPPLSSPPNLPTTNPFPPPLSTIQTPYITPILGGHKPTHLRSNISALGLALTPTDIATIESGYDFDIGFPQSFLNMAPDGKGRMIDGPQDVSILGSLGTFDYVMLVGVVRPKRGEAEAEW